MDPKKQECMSFYLYGAGFFSRDENTLSLLRDGGKTTPPHFCLSCPKRAECENGHERRVRATQPAPVERFDRLMKRAARKGFPPTLAARLIGKDGNDPFANDAIENFKRGHADRGAILGPLIK